MKIYLGENMPNLVASVNNKNSIAFKELIEKYNSMSTAWALACQHIAHSGDLDWYVLS